MSQAQWREVLDINLTGLFLSVQAEGRASGIPRQSRRFFRHRVDLIVDGGFVCR
jgi:hypothetical protein